MARGRIKRLSLPRNIAPATPVSVGDDQPAKRGVPETGGGGRPASKEGETALSGPLQPPISVGGEAVASPATVCDHCNDVSAMPPAAINRRQ